ncbi:MAG: HEAT repeat domain-containing protein [Armatimonadetes bacterium]|nr:HEAT repeat domain-containing protein [Armatimonadota bacterium]
MLSLVALALFAVPVSDPVEQSAVFSHQFSEDSVEYRQLTTEDDWITIGEITVFGQTDPDGRHREGETVSIRFPKAGAAPLPDDEQPHVRWGEWKIQLNEWGNLMRAYRGTGGWDEFRQLYQEAQERIQEGGSNVWKCKAVIFRRIDVVYKRSDGVLEPQRSYMNNPDLKFCLETFARYEALVEAFSGGALDVQLTVSVEEEPVSGQYEGGGVWSLDPRDAGRRFLRGRFNTGDFDCVLFMFHPGPTRSFSFGGTAGRSNRAPGAYVILSNGRERGVRIGHTEGMLHEWYHEVEGTYSIFGYGGYEYSWLPHLHAATQNGYTTETAGYSGWFSWLRDLMMHSVRPAMWLKIKNREEPDWDTAIRQTHRSDGALYRWADVKDDPWAKLPFLTPEDLAKRIGAERVEVEYGESQVLFRPVGVHVRTPLLPQVDPYDFSLNNELNFLREAVARIGYKDRDLLFVRFDAADFVIDRLGDHATGVEPPPNVLGYMNVDAKMMVVLDTRLDNDTEAELNLLRVGSERVGVVVKGAAEVTRDSRPRPRFESDVPDARFTVTDWSGIAVRSGEDGELLLSDSGSGTKVLKVTAVLPNGERAERPFVVRLLDPVDAQLEAVGTRRVSAATHKLRLTLQNGAQARNVVVEATLPAGWRLDGFGDPVRLAPGERKELDGVLRVPGGAEDGPVAVALDIRVEDYGGPVRTERLTLLRDTRPTLVNHTFETGSDGWDRERGDNAGWTAESVADGASGRCLAIEDAGGARWGRVNAFGGEAPPFMGYDAASFPYIDFYLKTEATHNLGLVAKLSDGRRFTLMLTGPYVEQWGESVELPRAKFIPNGEWQRIVYDLGGALRGAAGTGPHYVVEIGFGDTRNFSSNQWQTPFHSKHFVDEFRITREADLSQNTTAEDPDSEIRTGSDPASENPQDRARACAGLKEGAPPEAVAAVRALLEDPHPAVRLNAAAAFTRVKDPDAVEVLARLVQFEADTAIITYMVRALEHQDTLEAWDAIGSLTTLSRSPFLERGLAEAGLAMGRKGDLTLKERVQVLFAAKSWQSRMAGATALGMIDPSETLFIQFEIDPMVRLAATVRADPDFDLMRRRLEWASVNDLSHVVRAYSYARLTRAKDRVVRARGYSGLKEEDPEVRRIIAEEIGNDPQAHHVGRLGELLRDPNPNVRAAAVNSLLKMPGPRTFEQFSALAAEEYSQVLLPLLRAARSDRLRLPDEFLERLSEHRANEVRQLAKELMEK